jgi:hypothetical protein
LAFHIITRESTFIEEIKPEFRAAGNLTESKALSENYDRFVRPATQPGADLKHKQK